MGTLSRPITLYFFNAKNLGAYEYSLFGTSIHLKNINLQYLEIFLENLFFFKVVKKNGLTKQYGLRLENY